MERVNGHDHHHEEVMSAIQCLGADVRRCDQRLDRVERRLEDGDARFAKIDQVEAERTAMRRWLSRHPVIATVLAALIVAASTNGVAWAVDYFGGRQEWEHRIEIRLGTIETTLQRDRGGQDDGN